MRTTLTLDADVTRMVKDAMHCQRRSFKEVVNDSLRAALAPGRGGAELEPYQVMPHAAELLAGLDPRAFNRMAEELEDEALLARRAGAGTPGGRPPGRKAGADEPGTVEPGTVEPGTVEPGTVEPGTRDQG